MKTLQATLLATLIALTVACGYGSKNYAPVAGSIPAVAQLTPDNTNAGAATFVLTVNGTNFGSKAVVNFNGAAQPTTFVSANQITAMVPAAAVAVADSRTNCCRPPILTSPAARHSAAPTRPA